MKTLTCVGLLVTIAAQSSTGQPSIVENGWRIPGTESFVLRSKAVDRDYEIMIALPRDYAESSRKYPVLYLLDANGFFPVAVELARFLTFDRSTREEPIIAGIGYPVGRYRNTLPHRTRDFTPTSDPEWTAGLGRRFGFTPDGSGGAAAFLQFIANELIPQIEQRYRSDAARRTLYGYSMGGLFACYVLFRQPELFESYLIGAPFLTWDNGSVWKFEREFAESKRDLRARVLLSAGMSDQMLLPATKKLDELFRTRRYGGFVWQTQYFLEETHDSAHGVALSRGIRWLYGDLTPASVAP